MRGTVALLSLLLLAGCGGGGGSSPASPAPAPAPSSGEPSDPPPATTPETGDEPAPESDPEPTPEPTPEQTGCAPDDTERAMLDAVNAARASARSCGGSAYGAVPALSWNCKLEAAAAGHSADMASHNFFSHTGSDGLTVGARASAAGYTWSAVGENIAAGYADVERVMQGWLDSPGHCANIMSPNFTELGAASAREAGSDYGIYWTQVFGRPR